MAGPQANVSHRFTIDGVDNASAAINKAKESLKGLEGQAAATGAATAGIDAKTPSGVNVKGFAKDASKGLKGLSVFAGEASGELKVMGKEAKALSLILGVLPAPIGLIGVAVAGAGAAVYALAKSASEASARFAAFGEREKDVRAFGSALHLSAKDATELQRSIDDLPKRVLPPTISQLERVADAAKAIGEDPVQAQKEYTAALQGTREEMEKFLKHHAVPPAPPLTGVAKYLGISIELIRAKEKERTLEEQVADATKNTSQLMDASSAALDKQKKLREEILEAEDRVRAAEATASESRGFELVAARLALKEKREALAVAEQEKYQAEKTLEIERPRAERLAKELQATKDRGTVEEQLARRSAVYAAAAANAGSAEEALRIRLQALAERRVSAEIKLATLSLMQNALLGEMGAGEREKLRLAIEQIKAEEKAEAAKGKSAKSGKAAAKDESDTKYRLRKLEANAAQDGIRTEQEQYALAQAHRQAELDEVDRNVKGKKAQAAAKEAIEAEYASKVAQIGRDIASESAKVAEETQGVLEEQAKRSVELASSTAAAVRAVESAKAKSIAEMLRATGQAELADMAELRQARADAAAEQRQITAEKKSALATVAAGSTDAANIEIEATAKIAASKLALEDIERRIAQAAQDRARQQRSDLADLFEGPAAALRSLADAGEAFADAGALGTGLSAGIKAFKDIDKAMASTDRKAQEVTKAIGGAITGIADVAIDSELSRTKVQLANERDRALSTATTEEERAAITATYQKKMADAEESANRQKAGWAGAMQLANAVAAAAEGNFLGAAAHVVAASMYGAIAGGLVGGGAPVSAPTPSSGGFTSTGSSSDSGKSGGGGDRVEIYNFNQPFVTKQQIAAAMQDNKKSYERTGLQRVRGY